MKRANKPTRKQRVLIELIGLNSENWLVKQETADELVIIHRHTDRVRTIRK